MFVTDKNISFKIKSTPTDRITRNAQHQRKGNAVTQIKAKVTEVMNVKEVGKK